MLLHREIIIFYIANLIIATIIWATWGEAFWIGFFVGVSSGIVLISMWIKKRQNEAITSSKEEELR